MSDDHGGAGLDGRSVAPQIDPSRPSISRVYDFVLGGKQHFEIDRQVSEALFTAVPEMTQLAKDSRRMLARAVRFLVAEAGIAQIVDLGSGLPTEGNVHEVAHAVDPGVHVVYVDIDPIVLAHGRAILAADAATTTVITGDARDAAALFARPELTDRIDLSRPFAVIAAGILHHFDDAVAAATAAGIRDRLSPGSYAVFTNFLDDDEPRAKELEQAFTGGLGTGRFRTWAEQQRFFDGLEMVDPGLVYANEWRPDDETAPDSPVHTLYAGGIGHLPS